MSDISVFPEAAPWDVRTLPVESDQPMRLHDPKLTARLDALFDDHFRLPRRPSIRVLANHALKKALDLVVSACALAVLWPVFLIAGIATLCDTGWPIFYSQVRRIRFGRRARIYKMRTLVNGADRNLDALVNIKNNGRFLNIAKAASSYTRVGLVLERLWIVELPQVWNVFRGDMSLVGNRPIPDYVIGVLGPTHEVAERFASPQGLTGYTQIIGRDAVTDEERILLEYHYSRVFEEGNVFFEDLKIITLTVLTYLGLARSRTASDFLGDVDVCAATTEIGGVEMPSDTAPTTAVADEARCSTEPQFACPTCYEVTDACDSGRCEKECVTSCGADAIRIENGRPVILDACTACSACVIACPLRAIDKAPLHRVDGALKCNECGETYPEHDGVLDFIPRRKNLEQSPYFDFYEEEYLDDNPEMHLEDTEWKVRELRPLLRRSNRYDNLLDLGCGAGVLGERIAKELNVTRRTASDWSSQILSFARQRNGSSPVTYARIDAAYLPFRNGTYDLAMLIDVIEHQHKPEQVLRELQRTAQNLVVRTPLEDCWYESVRRKRKDLFRESSGHVVHFNLKSVKDYLARHGWRVRRPSVRHLAWSHWRGVIFGKYPLSAKATAAIRVALRWLLPTAVYRRLFVTNFNAFCESRFLTETPEPPPRTAQADRAVHEASTV